jgi:hypothetical protein
MSRGGLVAYGQYVVDNDGRIVCNILKRYIIENPADDDLWQIYYYNLFLDYYKLFIENDFVSFTLKHDPNLYYHQWQLTSTSGNEVYTDKDQYTKADMIEAVPKTEVLEQPRFIITTA